MQSIYLEGDPWETLRENWKPGHVKELKLSIEVCYGVNDHCGQLGLTLGASVKGAFQPSHLRTRNLGSLYISFYHWLVRRC